MTTDRDTETLALEGRDYPDKAAGGTADALAYSRNYATANPLLSATAKQHILGLCDLLERATASPQPEPKPADPAKASGSAPDELAKIGELIRTQDNRITDQPIFIVQQRRRIYGLDDGYCDGFVWIDGDNSYTNEERAERDSERADEGLPPTEYRQCGYIDIWEFVTACFTEQGCKDYLRLDGHNLREPRIYAAGSYRNTEFRTVRSFLMSLGTATPPASAPTGCELAAEAIEYHNAVGALECLYAAFSSMDNDDTELEKWPQRAIDALACSGWAVVPWDLPFAALGEAARIGAFETGNPRHGWDFLLSKTRIGPHGEPKPASAPGVTPDILRIPAGDKLDAIIVYFEDEDAGKGRVTVTCYGDAWTAWWGSMGNRTVRQFVAGVDPGYLSGALLQLRTANSWHRDYTWRVAARVISALQEKSP